MSYKKLSRAEQCHLELCYEIDSLEAEVAYYKKLYEDAHKELCSVYDRSISHGNKMMKNLVVGLMGVANGSTLEETLKDMTE